MMFFYIKKLAIITSILIVLSLIYQQFIKKNILNTNTSNDEVKNDEKDVRNSNIIKDIKYSSKDIKGNEYLIIAEEGEIDFTNPDIIFLKNLKTKINLKEKKEIITISANFGKYNTVTYDTIFSKDVIVEYLENKLTGNYLDFSMMNNILIMSKKVVYTNPKNILKADVIELNTITKETKIFMYNTDNKVKVINK